MKQRVIFILFLFSTVLVFSAPSISELCLFQSGLEGYDTFRTRGDYLFCKEGKLDMVCHWPGSGIQIKRGENVGRLVIPCDHIEASTKPKLSASGQLQSNRFMSFKQKDSR